MKTNMNIVPYEIESLIKAIYSKKIKATSNCKEIEKLVKENRNMMEDIGGYDPLQLKHGQYKYQDDYEKYINRKCWYFLADQFDLRSLNNALKHC